MKKILIAFLISLVAQNISAQIPYKCSDIDSIYVLSIDFDIEYYIPLTRWEFKEEFYIDGKYDIVIERDKIKEIYNLFEGLTPISTDDETCDCNKLKVIIDRNGIPQIYQWDSIDVRTLLVLYMQKKQALIWISPPTTEIDCQMYSTSYTLRSYISNYKYKYIYNDYEDRRIERNNISDIFLMKKDYLMLP